MDKQDLLSTTFKLRNPDAASSEDVYLYIKRIPLGSDQVLLQIVNITDTITKKNIQMEKDSLTVLNACVSHELRNPLNSISAQNIEQGGIISEMREILDRSSDLDFAQVKCQLYEKIARLEESVEVQVASSDFMTFLV